MKIAISTSNNHDLNAPLDPRFGRAANFVIIDTETGEWEAHPNPALNASGGAGIQAAQFVASYGVEAVISGDFGPNAYEALQAASIRMFVAREGTAASLLGQFKAGQLQEVQAPTSEARHQSGRGRGRGPR
jgi:predicted Fe-Mo cluster-binding NifX family protein